jgi:MtN3 and saliva related transmembrane protein
MHGTRDAQLMTDAFLNITGTLATVLGMVCYLPQIWKIWKEQSAEGISRSYLALHAVANVLWIMYAFVLPTYPLLISASLSTIQDALWIWCVIRSRLRLYREIA